MNSHQHSRRAQVCRTIGAAMLMFVALNAFTFSAVAKAQAGRDMTLTDAKAAPTVPGLDRIDVVEHLDAQLPLHGTFRTSEGKTVQLKDLMDDERPVLLTFSYHSCPVLCSLVLDGTVNVIKSAPGLAGKDYIAINISIDPTDAPSRAAEKKAEVLAKYGRAGADWHFLVAENSKANDDIAAITEAAGFKYFYNEAQEQYAHPAVVMFLTPTGKMARYLYGIEYSHEDATMALREAAKGKSLNTVDRILLYCYVYDPATNSYVPIGRRIMMIGGGITVFILGGFLLMFWRFERRKSRRAQKKNVSAGELSAQNGHA